jgi:hypothetical protein
MGQKVHPIGFRLGINKPWISKWFNLKMRKLGSLLEKERAPLVFPG